MSNSEPSTSTPSGKTKKRGKKCETSMGKSKKSKNLPRFVKIQPIFSSEKIKETVCEQGIEECKRMLKGHFNAIKDDYDIRVKDELDTDIKDWLKDASSSVNEYRRRLQENLGEGRTIAKFSFKNCEKYEENDYKVSDSTVTWIKPDRTEEGDLMKKFRAPCSRIEVGDISPPMIYWVPIEQSVATPDQLRLTHMPYFGDGIDDGNIYEHLIDMFPDGIHGFSDNWSYVNDWILYKLCRAALKDYQGSPDVFYYTLYRLWPNKSSQREFSSAFPVLCENFAEKGFDPSSLEPWKKTKIAEGAQNLRNPTCYACLAYTCAIHGFKAEIPIEFPNGEFYNAMLPLPNNPENDGKMCSGNCWKSVTMKEVSEVLVPDSEEILQKEVKIYFMKSRIAKMPIEDGALIVNIYVFNTYIPFCEFVKKYVDEDDEESKIRSCRDAYHLMMSMAENVSARRLKMGQPSNRLSIKDRVNNFRRNQLSQEKAKRKLRHDSLRIQALRDGLDAEKLIREDDMRDSQRNSEKVRMTAVTPITACRHAGPCNATAENCACRENGVCSYMCKCDINCSQRFPGCNCAAGQCYTKACQCYRANWECNPMTCNMCKCDAIDSNIIKCRNFGMTRMIQKRTYCGPSKIAGNGLFLLEPAEKDEFITEYTGERISDDEAERRGAIYDRYQCSYIFNIETGGAIDSYKIGNLARFANHDSKNPTCYARTMVVAGEHRIGFYAKRRLEISEELTFDYSYSGEHQIAFRMVQTKERSEKPSRPKSQKLSKPMTSE